MPDIRIQYRHQDGPGSMTYEEVVTLVGSLKDDCAERFSTVDWPLTPDDFSVYVEPLARLSSQTHNVIIRIMLHHFEVRVLDGDSNAADLAAKVSEFLNTEKMVQWFGRRTVGVSLVFAEIKWASA